MTVDEALKVTNAKVVEYLEGLPPQKIHCSVLAEEAIKAAVKDYYIKHNIAYDESLYCAGDCPCTHNHE